MKFLSYIGPKVIVFGLIIAFGLTVIISATAAKTAVNSAHKDANISDEDKANYSIAREYLGYAIALGWTVVAVAIVILIISGVLFYFGGDIALSITGAIINRAEAAEVSNILETISKAKNVGNKAGEIYDDLKQIAKDVEKSTRREQRGFIDFDGIFGGVLMKIVLFIILGFFFALGVLCANAASSINKTQDKEGYTASIIAASFGIGPSSLFTIWFILDFILHYTVYKPKADHFREKQKEILEEIKVEEAASKKDGQSQSPTLETLKSVGSSALSTLKAKTTEEQRRQLTEGVVKHVNDHAGEKLAKAAESIMGSILSS